MEKLIFGGVMLDGGDGGGDGVVVVVFGADGEGIGARRRRDLETGDAVISNDALQALTGSLRHDQTVARKLISSGGKKGGYTFFTL